MDYKEFFLKTIAPAIAILIIGLVVIRIVTAVLKTGMKKSKHVDNMMLKFVTNAVKIILLIVLFIIVANKFGVDTTSIVTMFAAAGAAIALALQGSLSNLASGILIIFTKPFSQGDYISSESIEGKVDSIDLLFTTIITADNKIVNMPNSSLTSNSIINWTKSGSRRLDINIGISYNADLEKAKSTLITVANSTGYYLNDKELVCHVDSYADSSIVLLLRGWVKAKDFWPATYAVNDAIKPALDNAGIEIPYPQIDVHQK